MNVYFDTSAIVKHFHVEEGTERVSALIQNTDDEIWLSELAKLEFVSALLRKYREGTIDDKQLESAISGFETDCAGFHVEPLGSVVTDEAERLLQRYGKREGLRTLDALHLAAFNLIADDSWLFVAADRTLCRTAMLEDHNVMNPIERE